MLAPPNRTKEESMDIRGLGYIGITAADVGAWRPYGEILGAMVSDDADGLRLRFDDLPLCGICDGDASAARPLRT